MKPPAAVSVLAVGRLVRGSFFLCGRLPVDLVARLLAEGWAAR